VRLVKKWFSYFPIIIIIFIIIFPGIQYRISNNSLPVITLGGVSVRITEIVFLFLVTTLIVLICLIKLTKMPMKVVFSSENNYINQIQKRNFSIFFKIFFFTIFIYCIVKGYVNNNPTFYRDIRVAFYFLFVPLFLYSIKSPEEYSKIYYFLYYFSLVNAILNILTIKVDFFGIGLVSHESIIINLYLLCIILAKIFYNKGKILKKYLLLIIVLFSNLIHMDKWVIFAIFVIMFFLFFLTFKLKKIKYFLKYLKIILIIELLLIFLLSGLFNFLVQNYYEMKDINEFYKIRILREDIGGDISSNRFDWWREIVNVGMKKPILGYGLGGNASIYELLSVQDIHRGEHSLLLWLFLRVGILGVILFYFFIYKIVKLSIFYQKNESDILKKTIVTSNALFIVGVICINFVSLDLLLFEVAILLCFSIATILFYYKNLINNNSLENNNY